jgi:hypothetical protein
MLIRLDRLGQEIYLNFSETSDNEKVMDDILFYEQTGFSSLEELADAVTRVEMDLDAVKAYINLVPEEEE